MDYATDTHSLVWYLTEDPLLSKKALKAFESTIREGIIIVPAVVLAEVMFISKKGKVTLTFEETLEKIENMKIFILHHLIWIFSKWLTKLNWTWKCMTN